MKFFLYFQSLLVSQVLFGVKSNFQIRQVHSPIGSDIFFMQPSKITNIQLEAKYYSMVERHEGYKQGKQLCTDEEEAEKMLQVI